MLHELDAEVTKRIAEANPTVREAVITSKVDDALARRKQLALDTLNSIAGYKKNLHDQQQDALFDGDGKPLMVGFNAQQSARRQQWKEEMTRLETALANALGEKADWTGLEK